MLKCLKIIVGTLRSRIRSRRELASENLALRQQLATLKYRCHRPHLRDSDPLFWVILSRIWANWVEILHIVQPATVIRWLRQGFRYYWRWKSRIRRRPRFHAETRELIRRMCLANPLWGAPRIHGELLDHLIVLDERHLKRLLSSYLDYYRPSRTHRSLNQDAPDGRRVRVAELDQIAEFPVVQVLHHYYLPRAA
jgi:hypothetical protein